MPEGDERIHGNPPWIVHPRNKKSALALIAALMKEFDIQSVESRLRLILDADIGLFVDEEDFIVSDTETDDVLASDGTLHKCLCKMESLKDGQDYAI